MLHRSVAGTSSQLPDEASGHGHAHAPEARSRGAATAGSGNDSAEAHEHEEEAEEHWLLVGRALLCGSAAIVVIGVGGLLAVLSIKWLTHMRFYDYPQQALIALAVGALIGDAFMHLIPHVRASSYSYFSLSAFVFSTEPVIPLQFIFMH